MDIIKAVKKLGNKLTGDTYTSKDLVKLIDEIADDYSGGGGGSGGGVVALVVNATENEPEIITLDKTAGEIIEAAENGIVLVKLVSSFDFVSDDDFYNAIVTDYAHESGLYSFKAGFTYWASSLDDYPSTVHA